MIRNYRVFHGLIDSIGVMSIIMIIGYVFFSESIQLRPQILDIWAGLSTELMGAWAAARVIEYAIRKNGDYEKVRIRIAKNLRYYPNLVSRIIEFNHKPDVLLMQRELQWTKRFYTRNKKCFSWDETFDLENAHNELDELLMKFSNENTKKEELFERLKNYELLALKAELNILEETLEV